MANQRLERSIPQNNQFREEILSGLLADKGGSAQCTVSIDEKQGVLI